MNNINITGNSGNTNVKGIKINKNMKIGISIGSAVVVIFAIFYFASYNPLENDIVGIWQLESNSNITWVFNSNHQFSMEEHSYYYTGTYSFTDKNSIQIQADFLMDPFILTGDIRIDNDKLYVSNIYTNDGAVDDSIIFVRIK